MAIQESITVLTQLSGLLFIGVMLAILSKKLRISNVLLLLLTGLLIGKLTDWFVFQPVFLVAIGILTLAMVVFQGTTNLSYRQVDLYSGPVLKLTLWYVVLATALVGLASYLLFFMDTPGGIILALVLAVSVAGTDPSSVMIILSNTSGAIIRILTLEAVVNTPIIVLIPFILLDLLNATVSASVLVDIAKQIIVGIGAGMVTGLVMFKAMRRFYSKDISPVAVLAGTIIAYVGAENLGGSGVLSVGTLGLLFGNFTIKKKEELQDFSMELSNILEMLIFLLIGIIIGGDLTFTWPFMLQSLAVFLVLFIARFIATYVTFADKFSWPQMLFISITMPKGIALAVLIFAFSVFEQIPVVLLSTLFMVGIYSILASTISGYWWDNRQPESSN